MPDLAIDGGPKAVAASMNDSWQDVSDQERQYVNQVLDNQDDAYAQLDLFDEALSGLFVGSKHALCMCNGTAALHSAIFAAGACAGKEVIAPTATWQVYGAGRADVRRRDSPSRKGRGYVAVPSLPVASFQRQSNSRVRRAFIVSYQEAPVPRGNGDQYKVLRPALRGGCQWSVPRPIPPEITGSDFCRSDDGLALSLLNKSLQHMRSSAFICSCFPFSFENPEKKSRSFLAP